MAAAKLPQPRLVFVFSGKRKSGKDFLTDELVRLLPPATAVVLRLSGPLKQAYADEHGLDYKRLLDASEYKEKYRTDMVVWGERKRREQPDLFCRLAIDMYNAAKFPVWIVSDARRKTDLAFFRTFYPDQTKFCRVRASEEVRAKRGWQFVAEIDNAETERGLDDVETWDFVMDNDGLTSAADLLDGCVQLVAKTLEKDGS